MASEYTILINGERYGGKVVVRAIDAEITGLYDERDKTITRPADYDIEKLLPYKLRKAFARSTGRFWFDDASRIDSNGRTVGNCPHLSLYGARGKYLATLYAIAN